MSFDLKKFETTKYNDRVADVEVPELIDFFDEDEKPVWKVRAMTGTEIAISQEAHEAIERQQKMFNAIVGKNTDSFVKALKASFNLDYNEKDGHTPEEIEKRLAMLRMCSVEPVCPENLAVKLLLNHGVVFYRLTNKIVELTGLGRVGELKGCGDVQKSKQP